MFTNTGGISKTTGWPKN